MIVFGNFFKNKHYINNHWIIELEIMLEIMFLW